MKKVVTPPSREPAPGLGWDELVAHWAGEHGSLAELALKLSIAEGIDVDLGSVERALRRLRGRGQRDGGAWGQRLLRAFGVPPDIERRVQWMGVYHSRFTDLPVSVCLDQLRVWDRPPVSESPAHVWIRLGFAACALRLGDHEHARARLRQARLGPEPSVSARIEIRLLDAYLASREGERARASALLAEVEPLLNLGELGREERECLRARWLDQRAYQLLHPAPPAEPDVEQARALYERISTRDVAAFVLAKRESGLAYVSRDPERAREHAEAACRHAGDGGFVRLRLSYLGLLAHILGPGRAADDVRERAVRAAARLEDEELVARLSKGLVRGSDRAESARPPPRREAASQKSASPSPRTTTKRRRP